MAVDLSRLNTSQLQAVLWNDGPVLVLAGPGSGKTTTLTTRVARLLDEFEDASILALTFTTKAAAEMRDRVDSLLGQRGDRTLLCTFHSFATDVLRQHGSHVGLRPDFVLLTQDEDRVELLSPIVSDLADDGHVMPNDLGSVLRLLDRLFADSYDGQPVAPGLHQTPAWLPLLFQRYCESLVSSNRADFGFLLHLAEKLLRLHPNVARVVRVGWTHVCVDEFQDTNKAQYALLRMIVDPSQPNLFVVGDEDQIMYQWSGASPEQLDALRNDFRMTTMQLPENHRCPAMIVDIANRLISRNRMRTPGKLPLVTVRPPGQDVDPVRYAVFSDADEEAQAVLADLRARALAPRDCVVLARTTKLLERVAEVLQSAGVECHLSVRKNQFQAPAVRVLAHALRLANGRHDQDVLRRLCVAWNQLTGAELEAVQVSASSALFGGDFLRAWSEAVQLPPPGLPAELATRIRASLVDRLEFNPIVEWFLETMPKQWVEAADVLLTEELETWFEIHEQILNEYGRDSVTLNLYLQQMDLAPKTRRAPDSAMRLLTVHTSKGLEFKHVYLIGMAQEVFPSFQALKAGTDGRELEEERRNCFVAITRTCNTLSLSRARQYGGWAKAPSQFIAEMELSE